MTPIYHCQCGNQCFCFVFSANKQKKKKKFAYKGKSQQYSLRNKQQEPEETGIQEKPVKKNDIIQRNVKNAGLKKGEKKEETKKKTSEEDYVTLTQNQFDKILETIGELSLAAEQNVKGKQRETEEANRCC